jgi:mannose-6-phosphate isomerase
MADPVRLTPSLCEKVWGRKRLRPWFPDSETPIGEAWYLADGDLPLLVKLLFTSERLSVQVHPDDGEDGARGKTEMWHILEAEPGASIALGFREPLDRERLREAALSGDVERLIRWIEVKPGETYFTPAHTVHAIGAGIALCEIQQNSDVTYRLWDYGRPRELHVEQAVAVADRTVHPGAMRTGEAVRSRHFVTELVRLEAGAELRLAAETCHLWIVLEGQGSIGGQGFRQAEVWLLPGESAIRAETAGRFLRTYVPGSTPDAG